MKNTFYNSAETHAFPTGERRLVYENTAETQTSSEKKRHWGDVPGPDIAHYLGKRIEDNATLLGVHAPRNALGALNVIPHQAQGVVDATRNGIEKTGGALKSILITGKHTIGMPIRETYRAGYMGAVGIRDEVRDRWKKFWSKDTFSGWGMPFKTIGRGVMALPAVSGTLGLLKGGKKNIMGDPAANDDFYGKNIFSRNSERGKNDVVDTWRTNRDAYVQWLWKNPVEHLAKPLVENIIHLTTLTRDTVGRWIRGGGINPVTGIVPFPKTIGNAIKPEGITELQVAKLEDLEAPASASNDFDYDNADIAEFEQWRQAKAAQAQQGRTGTNG